MWYIVSYTVLMLFSTCFIPQTVAEGATTDGVIAGTDTNPINGGIILDGSVTGTPEGVSRLNRALQTAPIIETAGPRVLGKI